jgi:small subunit ribosomal protein S2
MASRDEETGRQQPEEDTNLPAITMKELLEAGVHFGHRTHRWNPKMKRYIYGSRNGIYIIDLHQTLKLFEEAREYIQEVASTGANVLFVGTKKQAQEAVESAAKECGMYYVNQRWLGGMLTNFGTIQGRIGRLRELEKMEAEGVFEQLTKKEAAKLREERDKLERYLGGIKDMPGMPGAIFIVDLKKERIALLEARKLGIPVVAIVDTNCDPDEVDYVIPGNDDAIRAIKLMSSKMAEAINEVRPMPEVEEAAEEAAETEEVEAEEVDAEAEGTEDDEEIFIDAEADLDSDSDLLVDEEE